MTPKQRMEVTVNDAVMDDLLPLSDGHYTCLGPPPDLHWMEKDEHARPCLFAQTFATVGRAMCFILSLGLRCAWLLLLLLLLLLLQVQNAFFSGALSVIVATIALALASTKKMSVGSTQTRRHVMCRYFDVMLHHVVVLCCVTLHFRMLCCRLSTCMICMSYLNMPCLVMSYCDMSCDVMIIMSCSVRSCHDW